MSDEDPYLDTRAIAQLLGITAESVRLYLRRSRKRLAEGLELRLQDMPLPDLQVGRSPAWRASTIEAWRAVRPGRGRTIDQPRRARFARDAA
jgi:predicted DNA-binding transcriptional regulator AlpA